MGNVDVERDDKVLTVTLNRPEKHNALRRQDIDTIGAALADLGDARVVVFRGAGGRAFSAGVDVTEFLALDGADDARDFITAVATMLAAARTAPVTTICAVDGPCIGVAMELALACDLRVVTTRSRFGLPEIQLGLPSVVDASLLSQYVGLGAAKELILTGDLAAATDPRVAALATRLVEPEGLDAAVDELLARVTGHTATVLGSQKRLFEIWQNSTLTAGIEASIEEFAHVMGAADTREAIAGYGAAKGLTAR
jgi:enoyl-CoA hydratase